MMDCDRARTDMPLFVGEALSREECRAMLNHMEGCPRCRQEMEELGRVWKMLDRWEVEEPSPRVKSRLMATVRAELQDSRVGWWIDLLRSFVFPTVAGAIGLSLIIYLLFPYGRVINLCEASILNGGLLSLFPRGLIYFVLGLLYGLAPISISGIYFSRWVKEKRMIKGLEAGAISAGFLVPFFVVQCPEFTFGLVFMIAWGMVGGLLLGATGSLWLSRRARMEAS